jgi:predicted amidohydrolase YtcJ
MKKYFHLFLLLTAIIMLITSCSSKKKADLVIYNANIYTVNDNFDKAAALAVIDGKIAAVGNNKDILNRFKAPVQIDMKGKAVYPGFNDGHSHFLGYGIWVTRYANLVGTASFDEILDILKEFSKTSNSSWILGRGWDQNDWEDKNYPVNDKLNEMFPDKAVVLTRIDGHAVLANKKALEIAGITDKTEIPGGEVVKKEGKLTGVLIDNAADIMKAKIPPESDDEKTAALLRAQNDCFSTGLTTVTDAGLDKHDILLIDSLQSAGKLKMRVYAMMNPTQENFDYFFKKSPVHKSRLTVSAVKLYADGALGSRGALLLKPYSDMPGHYGLQLHPADYYDSVCRIVYDAGFQVCTHAIGDSANRLILKTYSKYLRGKNDLRWRIEHAQVVAPPDFNYFRKYSVIPSIQSTHCTSDMYWAEKRLGKQRIRFAYAYNKLLQQNGWLVNGTDFPIEDISPLKTFYAAVSRKDLNGWPSGGFQYENAISREDALRSITIWPAKGSFDEKRKGSLESGKVADFVVLDTDIMTCPELNIPKAKVLQTYLDGNLVWEAKGE